MVIQINKLTKKYGDLTAVDNLDLHIPKKEVFVELNGWLFLVIILTCFLFSALGVIAAMTINSHEDMGNLNTFIILPMSFLCGTFFSPNQLPDAVALFIEILPLTHASLCLREIARSGSILPVSLGVLVAYALALYAGAVMVMQRVRD